MMMMMMMMRIAVHVLTANLPATRSYVIDVVNSQAVNNADVTCPTIALVENRFTFVGYCSNSTSYLFFYRIYSL